MDIRGSCKKPKADLASPQSGAQPHFIIPLLTLWEKAVPAYAETASCGACCSQKQPSVNAEVWEAQAGVASGEMEKEEDGPG